MSKLRKTGIVLLILLIGIAGWQVYSYIERSTRPEPAVVYTVVDEPLTPFFNLFKHSTSKVKKGKYVTDRVYACNNDGTRKWLIQKNNFIFRSKTYLTPIFYLRNGTDTTCVFSDKMRFNPATPATIQTSLVKVDLKTGESEQLKPIGNLASFKLLHFNTNASTYFLGITKSQYRLIKWTGENTGFQSIFEPELAAWDKENLSILDGYCYGDTVVLYGIKQYFRQGQKGWKTTQNLIWLDADTNKVISHWVLPNHSDNPEIRFLKVEDFKIDYDGRYTIQGTPIIVKPPRDGRPPAILLAYKITDKQEPIQQEIVEPTFRIFELDPLEGVIDSFEIDPPKQDYCTGGIGLVFYDWKNDISHINVNWSSNESNTYGLTSDFSWTEPYPIHCSSMFSRLATDGTIWDTDFKEDYAVNKDSRIQLIRFDPLTWEKKIVAEGDNIVINFTLD